MNIQITVKFEKNKNPIYATNEKDVVFDLDVNKKTIKEKIIDVFKNNWSDWDNSSILSPQWDFSELYEETYLYEDDEDSFLDVSYFLIDLTQKAIFEKFSSDEREKLQFVLVKCSFEYDKQKYEFNLNDQYMEEWYSDYSVFKVTKEPTNEIEFLDEYEPNSY